MKKKDVKSMQELAAIMPEIYREFGYVCHAYRRGGGVQIFAMHKSSGDTYRVHGGSPNEALNNLISRLNGRKDD